MKKYFTLKKKLLGLVFIFAILSFAQQPTFISPTHQDIEYVGRISFADSLIPEFYWSGTSVSINFKGQDVSVILKDKKGHNYYNVIIDEDSIYPLKLKEGEHTYLLASGLKKRKNHKITLFKRNEWMNGSTQFKGFTVNGRILPKTKKARRFIEFYGNSITAGYAIEDTTGGDSPDGLNTNNYNTYAAITSRFFNADMHCIVRSGIGVNISWNTLIMPEMFDRTNPRDPESKWDFSSKIPDLIVVNLMQNDYWLVKKPEHEQYKIRFANSKPNNSSIKKGYSDFISSIREKYPDTPIICALGSMNATQEGSIWPQLIKDAVSTLNDENIYTLVFPFIKKTGHPRVEDNKKMATQLISFIEELNVW